MIKHVTTAIILRIVLVGFVAAALATAAHAKDAKPHVQHQDIHFTKAVDKSSPTVFH